MKWYSSISNRHPDISILLVCRPMWSRGLRGTLESIVQHTANMNNIEVVLKVDHDASEETYQVVREYQDKLPLKTIIMDGAPRRHGVPEYVNTMAWNASGKLLWWWSDEVRMTTPDWDAIMKGYLQRWDNTLTVFFDETRNGFYPGMTRRFLETIGRFTYHLCLDSFLDLVGGPVRSAQVPPVLGPERTRQIHQLEIVDGIRLTTQEFGHADFEKECELFTTTKAELSVGDYFLTQGPLTDLNDPKVKNAFTACSECLLEELQKRRR